MVQSLLNKYFILSSPFLVLLIYKISIIFNWGTFCIWKNLTGNDCIGCGITRAIIAILKGDMLAYGGDFNVRDQQGAGCCNGICDPYSKPHSIYYEFQHAFQPIIIEKLDNNKLSIYNRNYFIYP